MGVPQQYATWQRKITFAALYLSEGAPIGYLWLALPTRLRTQGVAVEDITWLAAVLVLPWTFKFLWAPIVDVLRFSRWGFRHWVFVTQTLMGLSLVPLFWLDPVADFRWLALVLVAHAFCAATQDVSIDGLCISSTPAPQRGELNGWMQLGMFVGRAMMGGGALVMSQYLGDTVVIALLIGITSFSMCLLVIFPIEENPEPDPSQPRQLGETRHWEELWGAFRVALASRNTWLGFAFALLGGACFKSFEVIYGPFLVDRGYSEKTIGWFSAGPMILSMIVGALLGGRLADRRHRIQVVGWSLGLLSLLIMAFAAADKVLGEQGGWHLWIGLVLIAVLIGVFTAASYALFMDLTVPRVAAAQFSGYMGATNGCESWSTFVIGRIIDAKGYPLGMGAMGAVSLVSLLLLIGFRLPNQRETTQPSQAGLVACGNTSPKRERA